MVKQRRERVGGERRRERVGIEKEEGRGRE